MSDYAPTVKVCCRTAKLPLPELEYRFHQTRKWRFDFAWPVQKVALEVDGGVWSGGRHGRGSGIVKEHEKFNAAAADGWLIFRCTPQNVADAGLYRLLKRALGA